MSLWRTMLGRTLLAWMLVALAIALGCGFILEHVSFAAIQWLVAVVFLGAPCGLLVWMAPALWQAPRTYWPALAAMLAFSIAYVAAAGPLFRAGLYLNFLVHRDAYDAVIAASKAGRLPVTWRDGRCIRGEMRGVRYGAGCVDQDIFFPWSDDAPGSALGVVYSETDCPRLPDPPAPPAPAPGPGDPPVIRNAGKIGTSVDLSGRYCFLMYSY